MPSGKDPGRQDHHGQHYRHPDEQIAVRGRCGEKPLLNLDDKIYAQDREAGDQQGVALEHIGQRPIDDVRSKAQESAFRRTGYASQKISNAEVLSKCTMASNWSARRAL